MSNNGYLQDEVVEAKGRLDEVQALTGSTESNAELFIEEGRILGGGAFSRVAIATVINTGRVFALKCMRKSGVVHCPQHVYCEQMITKNTAHPFCLRQYASFQDEMNLYFLFDLMNGGDLMDILVAEAKVRDTSARRQDGLPVCVCVCGCGCVCLSVCVSMAVYEHVRVRVMVIAEKGNQGL